MTYKKSNIFLILLILNCIPQTVFSQGVNVREERIKAACIYHISKFVTWPSKPKKKFVICAKEENSTYNYLKDIFSNKKINNTSYEVKNLNEIEKAETCHLIFVGNEKISKLSNFNNKNSLLVSSAKELFSKQIPLSIYKTKNKIAINIKLDTLKTKGYEVSSELLRIAVIK